MSMNGVALQIVAKTLALPGMTGVFTSPFRREFRLAAGEKWFSGDSEIVGFYFESNKKYAVAEFWGLILHRLSDPTDSAAYLFGEMLYDMDAILDPDWIAPMIGVKEAREPRIELAPTRIGDVIEYQVVSPVVLESV